MLSVQRVKVDLAFSITQKMEAVNGNMKTFYQMMKTA
jgi:hypothetical protein